MGESTQKSFRMGRTKKLVHCFVRNLVARGGDRLFSVSKLKQAGLNKSLTCIRAALDSLAKEGRQYRKEGRGLYRFLGSVRKKVVMEAQTMKSLCDLSVEECGVMVNSRLQAVSEKLECSKKKREEHLEEIQRLKSEIQTINEEIVAVENELHEIQELHHSYKKDPEGFTKALNLGRKTQK